MINLNATLEEDRLICRIVEIAKRQSPRYVSRSYLAMDLINCHLNACPLDLEAMASRSSGDAIHDLDVLMDTEGIAVHLDRPAGQLIGTWRPRFRKETQ